MNEEQRKKFLSEHSQCIADSKARLQKIGAGMMADDRINPIVSEMVHISVEDLKERHALGMKPGLEAIHDRIVSAFETRIVPFLRPEEMKQALVESLALATMQNVLECTRDEIPSGPPASFINGLVAAIQKAAQSGNLNPRITE